MITILTLATTVASLYILSLVLSLHRNYAVARASGLRCIIVPFHLANVSWVIIQPLILPLLDRLPTRWTSPWLPFLSMDRCWSYGHAAFAGTCTDTVIAVSAWGNILHTCDAGASAQLFQGSTFEKPAKLLALLNIYGPTMTGTEHHETRLYRKVAAPFFNEKTMRKTWDATVQDAQALGKVLSGNAGGPTQRQLRPTLAKLTLHVVNKVCFEADRDIVEELEFRPKAEQGHRLSYSNAMHTVMENLRELFAIPKPILNFGFKTARQAQMELDQYLEELIERKNDQLTNDNQVTDQGLLSTH
jgi:cytochrome P450